MINKIALLLPLLLLGTPTIATAKPPQQQSPQTIAGDCAPWDCQKLVNDLRRLYPKYVQQFQQNCPTPEKMTMRVFEADDRGGRAIFDCWEAQKDAAGTRSGKILGMLPVPGKEAGFLVALPDKPKYPDLLKHHAKEIRAAQFRCATYGGGLLWSENEADRTVQLQCFFQAGVILFDENDDFKWDGDTRGAGVDETLATFPISAQPLDKYCQLTAKNQSSWKNCLDRRVKIKGKKPRVVMSHVQRNPKMLEEKKISQGYMDALNYQFVLLSEQPITCPAEFEVEGTLKQFSLASSSQGNSQRKGSYSNYDIQVDQFTCLGR